MAPMAQKTTRPVLCRTGVFIETKLTSAINAQTSLAFAALGSFFYFFQKTFMQKSTPICGPQYGGKDTQSCTAAIQ